MYVYIVVTRYYDVIMASIAWTFYEDIDQISDRALIQEQQSVSSVDE